jgi:hypothetical protein
MNAVRMLAHLNDGFRMATGELPVERGRGPLVWALRLPPLNHLAACFLPFGQGLPTAPELISRAPDNWEIEVHQLRAHLAACGERGRHGSWAEHPYFGKLHSRAWGVLGYRHIAHHLRQFGV